MFQAVDLRVFRICILPVKSFLSKEAFFAGNPNFDPLETTV